MEITKNSYLIRIGLIYDFGIRRKIIINYDISKIIKIKN
jgi:hypothetical protein